MSRFEKGQRVKVEFEGMVDRDITSRSFWIKRDDGILNSVNPEICKVTLLDPPGWPPQQGDIWEADGREWYARTHFTREGAMVLSAFEPRQSCDDYYQGSWDQFKALNPVLVRRRGQ